MYYKDVPETGNIDLILEDKKEIVVVNNIDMVTANVSSELIFTDDLGIYKIAATGLTGFEIGDQIIIRDSIGATPAFINNDGLYTVTASEAAYIEVAEPVIPVTSVSATASVDEYATFILHPTKRTGQICIYVDAVTDPSAFEVSFKPGGYWASKIETGLPVMQGAGVADGQYLIQIETAPYLQTEEEALITAVTPTYVDKKGTLLMRVFAPKGEILTNGVGVALVQLA